MSVLVKMYKQMVTTTNAYNTGSFLYFELLHITNTLVNILRRLRFCAKIKSDDQAI